MQEGVRDELYLTESQSAFVELAVLHLVADDVVDHAGQGFAARLVQASRGSLHGVGEHDDGGFARLRLPPGVAEPLFEAGRGFVGAAAIGERLIVEVANKRGAMVLRDDVAKLLGKPVLLGDLQSVPNVGGNDQRR